MVVNDKVWGSIFVPEKYECIVNSRQIQNLKTKKQLGMVLSDKAVHTRFDHSLGVYFLACKLVDTIKVKLSDFVTINEIDEDAIKIMALTHDIGHGPFSHLAERLLNESHENNTVRLLKEDTDIHNIIINNFSKEVLDKVIYLIELKEKIKNNSYIDNNVDIMFIVSKLLSGGIDIDRLDYIARDSYHVLGTVCDYSDILNYINLDYLNDYLEIVFDKEGEYLIANYLNKRYELYDTVYLNDKKFVVETCLDKLIKTINYPIAWHSDENEILSVFKNYTNCGNLYIQRLVDIVLNKNVDDDIKYLVFENKKEYDYFLERLTTKYVSLNLDNCLFTTSNKLNIYSNKNKIYVKKDNIIMEMNECPILNSNLQREKYIIGIDFRLLSYLELDASYFEKESEVNKLKKEFSSKIELEKKYLYKNSSCTEEVKDEIIKCLQLKVPSYVTNMDVYYDCDSKLKAKGMTLRNRVTENKDVWNIKEKLDDKSSVTKRTEYVFDNLDEVLTYLKNVKNIDMDSLNVVYSSITNRCAYKLDFKNSTFELAFDHVVLDSNSNQISFDMIECELKKGYPIDLYYLNNIMHSFSSLIDCSKSKNEMVENIINSSIKIKKKEK